MRVLLVVQLALRLASDVGVVRGFDFKAFS